MDYTQASLSFKIKKALRYIRLYGLRRTLAKIRGQYHMKRRFERLPSVSPSSGGSVAIIGCGNYAYANIAYYLRKNYGAIMRAAMDIDINRAASLYERYGLRYYTNEARKLIRDPEINLIYIASNHASHAEYAIEALRAGKSVHIEKPHVVTKDQLIRLCLTMKRSSGKVFLGFNRSNSKIGLMVKEALHGQSGAAMLNWFVAGHEIPSDHWYFKSAEGGRILGNLCHWTDFTYRMVEPEYRYPITITPTSHEKSDCDIAVTFTFGDGTIAAITFSAKGHTFEGVREVFSAHRGNVLVSMKDFKSLVIENVDRKIRRSQLFRDHGHESNIRNSFEMAVNSSAPGEEISYVWESGELFLKTKEALETKRPTVVRPFDVKLLGHDAVSNHCAVNR
jgi:predicted dehydrogenase